MVYVCNCLYGNNDSYCDHYHAHFCLISKVNYIKPSKSKDILPTFFTITSALKCQIVIASEKQYMPRPSHSVSTLTHKCIIDL